MSQPKTLLQLANADLSPARLDSACLVLIDYQNEYLQSPLAVSGAEPALKAAQHLLDKARQTATPVIHIAHRGRPGSLFDRDAERGQIIEVLSPQAGERVIEKNLPNSFAGTPLQEVIAESGRKEIIVCGFMTHMCVSSTARAALDIGLRTTLAGDACATRNLPDGQGGSIDAETIHNVALAELSDRFAIIASCYHW